MVASAYMPLCAVARTVVCPAKIAVMFPLWSTVATVGLLLVHTILLSVVWSGDIDAVSCITSYTSISSEYELSSTNSAIAGVTVTTHSAYTVASLFDVTRIVVVPTVCAVITPACVTLTIALSKLSQLTDVSSAF